MQVFGRKLFSEAWIVTAVLILTSAAVLAGSPGDLKPRVPQNTWKKPNRFTIPLRLPQTLLPKGKSCMRERPFVQPVTGLKGLGEQVVDGARHLARNSQPTLPMPPGRLPGQTGKFSGSSITVVMARTWRPTCHCIYRKTKSGTLSRIFGCLGGRKRMEFRWGKVEFHKTAFVSTRRSR